MMNTRFYLALAALSGFLVVAMGAFGAHALKDLFSEYQHSIWNKAVLYQMFHSVALFGTVILGLQLSDEAAQRLLRNTARMFTAGIVLFSGSLYLLALTGVGKLGMVTPVGGIAFLIGWLTLLRLALKAKPFKASL